MAPLAELSAAAGLALALAFAPAVLAGSVPDGTPTPPAQRGVNIGSGPKAPVTDRLRTLFLMDLSREPRPEEYSRLENLMEAEGAVLRQRLGDILWALLNSAEFRLNH